MVIVQLMGGLGNQLFQYAAGRALALRGQTELELDLGEVGEGAYRPYSLGAFDLPAETARIGELPFEFRQAHRSRFARRVYARLPRRLRPRARGGPRVIREKSHAFDESLISARGDVYLVGFWQSPKYFEDFASVIRSDLALTRERAAAGATLTTQVRREGTVSVHVRRGDYVSHPANIGRFVDCSPEYYEQALELLSSRVEVRTVYLFSDDIGWAERELRFAFPTVYVSEQTGMTDTTDFFLMSQCEHHVIANSTFSWWAAWLGRHSDGLVVAPSRWFMDTTGDIRDLYPADWLVL
jgi:hypothetical protein